MDEYLGACSGDPPIWRNQLRVCEVTVRELRCKTLALTSPPILASSIQARQIEIDLIQKPYSKHTKACDELFTANQNRRICFSAYKSQSPQRVAPNMKRGVSCCSAHGLLLLSPIPTYACRPDALSSHRSTKYLAQSQYTTITYKTRNEYIWRQGGSGVFLLHF